MVRWNSEVKTSFSVLLYSEQQKQPSAEEPQLGPLQHYSFLTVQFVHTSKFWCLAHSL